jgi:hypothetical protein
LLRQFLRWCRPRHRSPIARRTEAGFKGGTEIFEFSAELLDVISRFGFNGCGRERLRRSGSGGDVFAGKETTKISDKPALSAAGGDHLGDRLA